MTAARSRTWRFPQPVVENLLALTGMLAVGTVLAWATVAVLIDRFGTLGRSVWDPISGIAFWYVAFIGGYAMFELLPKSVANGRTRRDSAIEMAIFGVIHSAVLAILITLMFAIEQGVYGIFDWPQGVPENHLFDSFTDYPVIFLESLLSAVVWTVGGAMIGIGFYRDSFCGAIAVVVGLGLVSLQSGMTGMSIGPLGFVTERLQGDWGIPLAVLIALAGVAITGSVTWLFARDVPIRPK